MDPLMSMLMSICLGIEDLLAAYLEFRQRLDKSKNPPIDGGPQLIIMGHGSIDDPDGSVIYENLHEIVSSRQYDLVQGDVAIVRAPPSDAILGCILQGAWVATQLSTREGFEVKVTEVSDIDSERFGSGLMWTIC